MWQKMSIAAAVLLIVLSRVCPAMWRNDKEQAEALRQAAAKVDSIPSKLGPWQGAAEQLDPDEVAQARLVGYCWRRYRHSRTGEVITMLLVCGRPGPVSVHTPDVCYRGAGYTMTGSERRTSFEPAGSPPAELWLARFHKPSSAAPENLNIYWGWNAEGSWEAPENPRLSFAHHHVLFKLYVIADEHVAAGPFLDLLLPALAGLTDRAEPAAK